MTADLVQFLRDRLDEDERAARACPGDGEWTAWALEVYGPGLSDEVRTHAARHDPARVLAEVEAKRQLLELHHAESVEVINGDGDERSGQWCWECDGEPFPCRTLRALALPYADHEAYRPEWAP